MKRTRRNGRYHLGCCGGNADTPRPWPMLPLLCIVIFMIHKLGGIAGNNHSGPVVQDLMCQPIDPDKLPGWALPARSSERNRKYYGDR